MKTVIHLPEPTYPEFLILDAIRRVLSGFMVSSLHYCCSTSACEFYARLLGIRIAEFNIPSAKHADIRVLFSNDKKTDVPYMFVPDKS